MRLDECGNPVTGASAAGVERYDAAVRSLLRFADDVEEAWEAVTADDPGFVLGQIGQAYLRCLSSEGPDARGAQDQLASLEAVGSLTDRERRHLDAARAYASGDLAGAAERLGALSVEYPLDPLALVVGHQLDFFCGDAAGLRDRPARALLAWDPGHPLFGFVLGMHAFGLEETNLYPQAEAAGRSALDAEPRDVWALHAVVHVHEMQARVEEALRFLDERRPDWTDGNFFVVHNAWHEALFRLELGDVDGALGIYDGVLHHDGSAGVALEMLDASALLWRLHLDGIDVGVRWSVLAAAWMDKTEDESWYVFNDVHATMAFVGAGRLDHARALVARLGAYAQSPDRCPTNVSMTSEVGLPVCEALLAFGEQRYADAVDLLLPIQRTLHRFGGSNAQRDAIARTLLEAAVRSGRRSLAEALVSERLALREASRYAHRQRERIARAVTA